MHPKPSRSDLRAGRRGGQAVRVPECTPGDGQKDLVERLRAGDPESYEYLVRNHGGRMLAVAQRLLRDEELARDAVQEAFLSAFRGIDRFREGAQVTTWLHRITVNAALMRLRHRACRPEVRLDEVARDGAAAGGHFPGAGRSMADAEVDLLREESRRAVRRCIDRLPSSHRTVLLLRDVEELDTARVAEMLGITANAVKIRVHRARQALARMLDEEGLGNGKMTTPGSRDQEGRQPAPRVVRRMR